MTQPVGTVSSRPRLDRGEAEKLADRLYGLAARAKPLPSERDQNFHLTAARGEFVLKIAGASERADALDLQDAALEWLAGRAPSLPIPRLLRTTAGEPRGIVGGAGGARYAVRLLTYLPGMVLADARPKSPALLERLGGFLGELDAALDGFRHPAASDRDLLWDPGRAAGVIEEHLGSVGDPSGRTLIEEVLRRHRAIVRPLLPGLRRSVIHNDANDYNVLVGSPAFPAEDRTIAGLLDFGDMVESWTVCELAVAIAYATLALPDPLAAAARVTAGYHRSRPLAPAEIEAAWTLAALRLCTSVCVSAHRRGAEPEDPYLTVSEAPAWEALRRMGAVHPNLAHYALREACGLPPCPRSGAVVSWLEAHPAECGKVVDADLEKAAVFDFSVGSPGVQAPARQADVHTLMPDFSDALRESGASAGIGRYGEARLVYGGDAFAVAEDAGAEHPERRTIHMAIDIFVPPGSPVYTPLPGRIHSARDNAAPYDYGPTIIVEHAPADGPVFWTLYGHLSADSLAGLRPGMPVARNQRIGSVGAPPGNGGWPPHVHFQIIADLLGREGEFPGVAAASRRGVWLSISPDPNVILRMPEDRIACADPTPGEIRQQRSRLLGPSLSLSYRRPLEIVRGAGTLLYDQTGRAYLDMVNNVAHVGHCHPRVVRAGAGQMGVLNTNTRYLHPAIVEYARRLTATLPEPLSVCFLVCSGSEANELALRLARAHTRARDILVVEGAYHGNTQGLVDVSPYKHGGPGGEGAPPWVHAVPMPDDYRGLHRRPDPDRGTRFADFVREAAETTRPAAFLCESLLSCGGQIELPPGYLEAAYRHARAAGAVCIADEVQVGFGRVGTHFWGFQTQNVVPDIVTMGKPIGNGHPLGAVVTTPEIAASFANGMEYFNTFGGNPVSCAIGLAVLDVIRDEDLQERARRVGGHLRKGLEDLMARHAILGDARGRGLFLGIELVLDRETRTPAPLQAAYVVERMKDHGILLSTDGPDHNVIKMKPPLPFGQTDADRVVAAYDRVLSEDFVRWR